MSRNDKRVLRGAARFYAVQALFQMEKSGQNVEQVRREFEAHRIGAESGEEGEAWVEADLGLFGRLIDQAVEVVRTVVNRATR